MGTPYWWHIWSDFEMVLVYHFYISNMIKLQTSHMQGMIFSPVARTSCWPNKAGNVEWAAVSAKPKLLQLRKWDSSPKLGPEAWIYQATWRVRTWHVWTCEIHWDLRVQREANGQNSHAKPSLQDQKVDLASVGKYLSAQAVVIARNAEVIVQVFSMTFYGWSGMILYGIHYNLAHVDVWTKHRFLCPRAWNRWHVRWPRLFCQELRRLPDSDKECSICSEELACLDEIDGAKQFFSNLPMEYTLIQVDTH